MSLYLFFVVLVYSVQTHQSVLQMSRSVLQMTTEYYHYWSVELVVVLAVVAAQHFGWAARCCCREVLHCLWPTTNHHCHQILHQ
jgi:hypothetical protein